MNNLTLRQLRYFDALATHRHFGRAAAACAISQPALSMQIKEMETTLSANLFERGPRDVRLTGLGVVVADRARAILRSVDDLQDFTRAASGTMLAQVRLGVIPTVAPYLLPRLVARLMAAHPGIDLNLRETVTPKLIAELHDGRLDAAIVALPVSEPGLTEMPLFSEEFVLVRPAFEANLPVPGPDGLRTMRLLLLEEGHCFRDQALSFCNRGGATPRELLDGSSLSTLVQMVGAGLGVTLIPDMAVPVETRAASVAVARFPSPAPSRTIGMVWRRASPLSRQFCELAEAVRATGPEAPGPGLASAVHQV